MEKLKAIRSGHRSVTTRLINKTNDKILENDFKNQELSAAIETLVKKRNLLEDFDSKILDGTEVEDIEQEIVDSDEYNLHLDEAIHKFKDIISNSGACVPKPTDVVTCVQKPPILIQKDDIVESDFEENQVKHPSRQTAAREIHISEKNGENDRDGGTGNTYYSEVTEEKSKLKDDMNQQIFRPTHVKTEDNVSNISDVKINKEETEKKFEEDEKTRTSSGRSIPQDSCSSMLCFLKRIGLERYCSFCETFVRT